MIPSRSNKDNVRFGVIGFGVMGQNHAQWLNQGLIQRATLAAICDIDKQKLELAKAKYGDIPLFDNHLALMDSQLVDAVIIATPHYLHPEMAIDSMQRGIHPMIEKPIAVYTKAVHEVYREAAKHPTLVCALMYNERSNPVYQKAKEFVDSGRLGSLRRATWITTDWWRPQSYYDSSTWRASWKGEGGGVLINQAPHQIDLMQWICGMPEKIWADLKFGSHRRIETEDDVTAHFMYPGGAVGTFIICTHDVLGTNYLEITFDKGKIIAENSKKLTVKILKESENDMNLRMSMDQAREIINGARLDDICDTLEYTQYNGFGEQHRYVLNNFCDAILDNMPLFVDITEGINGLSISNAMHLSGWLRQEVSLPLDEELFYAELRKRFS